MKKRLKDKENETVTNCNALKLKVQDGKHRLTDVLDTKGILKEEGNELVTNCDQLKLKSKEDKYYNTDVVDIEGMFIKIILCN